MSQTITVTFSAPDPIRTSKQLEDMLAHLDSAGFAVGVQVEGAEIDLNWQRHRASDQ